jgi:hypothetical protein
VLLVGLSLMGVTRMTDLGREIEQNGLFEGPLAVARRVARTASGLHTSPPIDDWAPTGAAGGRALARYVHECTSRSDRPLALAYEPEHYYYADRGLATR